MPIEDLIGPYRTLADRGLEKVGEEESYIGVDYKGGVSTISVYCYFEIFEQSGGHGNYYKKNF